MSAIVLLLVSTIAGVWLQQVRVRRQRWLRDLALSGSWECVVDGRALYLDLRGGSVHGDYEERFGDGGRPIETGTWEVRGQGICFAPVDGAPSVCELRAFADGSLGIHGGARKQRIYHRRVSNVIPLRVRK